MYNVEYSGQLVLFCYILISQPSPPPSPPRSSEVKTYTRENYKKQLVACRPEVNVLYSKGDICRDAAVVGHTREEGGTNLTAVRAI